MNIKTLILILSIVSLVFITAFFVVQIAVIKNNTIISGKLQTIFGIGFLIISICIFVFLIIAIFEKINIPVFIEVNLFEIFIVAVIIGVVSFFLISNK